MMMYRFPVCCVLWLLLLAACNKSEELTETLDGGRRTATGESQARCTVVHEFLPAPGQFVNEGCTATTMAEACSYALQRLEQQYYVSLGAFGGYIVVGFDHSIRNSGGYDLAVRGNATENASEPGVVWVMQDTNANGLPDDTWYQLAGSETGKSSTWEQYRVTYYRPASPNAPVAWRDDRGHCDTVQYLSAYHHQTSYYPAWVACDSLTLTGTRLEALNRDTSGSGTHWELPAYAWGYADNLSPSDCAADDPQTNRFRISDAVDAQLQPVSLPHIDFVKVQTAVAASSGWLGECSTEVCGICDLHIDL